MRITASMFKAICVASRITIQDKIDTIEERLNDIEVGRESDVRGTIKKFLTGRLELYQKNLKVLDDVIYGKSEKDERRE